MVETNKNSTLHEGNCPNCADLLYEYMDGQLRCYNPICMKVYTLTENGRKDVISQRRTELNAVKQEQDGMAEVLRDLFYYEKSLKCKLCGGDVKTYPNFERNIMLRFCNNENCICSQQHLFPDTVKGETDGDK